MDVLDGKRINPDSGVKDPVPGPLGDYLDEYEAAGLDETIPWYQVRGNHDHFWMGLLAVNDYLRQVYVGEDILNMGNALIDPRGAEGSHHCFGTNNEQGANPPG
jgi:hypothetical protein